MSLKPTIPSKPQKAARKARPGGRSARIRDAVRAEAASLLIEKGFQSFSIAEVAARAGVHETSIYRRWGAKTAKSALALDACLAFAENALSTPDKGALQADLFDLMSRLAAVLQSPTGKALLGLCMAHDPQSIVLRKTYWAQRFAAASVMIERAVQRGEIPKGVNAAQFIEALIAPLWFRALVTLEPIGDWPIEQMIDAAILAARRGAYDQKP